MDGSEINGSPLQALEEALSKGEDIITQRTAEMVRNINARAAEWGWSKERRDQELVEQLGQVRRVWEIIRAAKEAARAVAGADLLPVAAPVAPAAAEMIPSLEAAQEEYQREEEAEAAPAVADKSLPPMAAPEEELQQVEEVGAAPAVADRSLPPMAAPELSLIHI